MPWRTGTTSFASSTGARTASKRYATNSCVKGTGTAPLSTLWASRACLVFSHALLQRLTTHRLLWVYGYYSLSVVVQYLILFVLRLSGCCPAQGFLVEVVLLQRLPLRVLVLYRCLDIAGDQPCSGPITSVLLKSVRFCFRHHDDRRFWYPSES